MKLESVEDPTGTNLSKKITISLWTGPVKMKETYKCGSCKDVLEKKVWDI